MQRFEGCLRLIDKEHKIERENKHKIEREKRTQVKHEVQTLKIKQYENYRIY